MSFENTSGLGVVQHYGTRDTNQKFGGEVTNKGNTKEVVYTFDYDDLPSGGDSLNSTIPASSTILSATLIATTAMTGTSGTLTLGIETTAGGTIDADGIDVAVAQAVLVADSGIVCDGALVGVTIGTAAGQLVATTGGTVTGGVFKVVIVYAV